jgi:hypothetical protein
LKKKKKKRKIKGQQHFRKRLGGNTRAKQRVKLSTYYLPGAILRPFFLFCTLLLLPLLFLS